MPLIALDFSAQIKSVHKLICVLLLLSLCPIITTAETALSENQAKAALLYNFMKHTQWPEEAAINSFNVAFIGPDEDFFNEFKTIASEIIIRGKKINVIQTPTLNNLAHQDVIVVAQANNLNLKDITSRLLRTGTLIVTNNVDDQKLVMINFLHTPKNTLSFEVNKSNIVYEGLKISNDVLLFGGTEIEIATLYKEMEYSLKQIKDQVELNKQDLKDKISEIDQKNNEILTLKNKTDEITNLLTKQKELLDEQQQRSQLLDHELDAVTNRLKNSTQQLLGQQQLVSKLAEEIQQKQNTLKTQEEQINVQRKILNEKTAKVSLQENIISSQRNVIVTTLALLLLLLLFIIQRQKQAIARDKQLLETKTALITAQEESIKAFESSIKLKNDFLTAISHEMRTPMNGIWGALQIADNQNIESLLASMQIIEKSSAEMINLVDDILSYIEIQSEQMDLQQAAVNISALLNNIRQHYTPLCQEKSLQLNWHVSDNISTWLILDKNKFSKIIHKLLDNALKFTNTGAITVIAKYQDGQLFCTIKDSGSGITEEDQAHIFEAFWQKETGFARRFSGLGIGLTICEKLVKLMSGTIGVSSTPGEGTQFSLSIPAETTAISNAFICEQMEIHNNPILIVEDNPINQDVLRRMLLKLGYASIIANDGNEALAVLEHTTPSLILMDLQMPNMDGFTCTRVIRQKDSPLKNIPIIAVTANLMESQQVQCIQAGMHGYLSKPLEMKQLQHMLEQYLLA